MSDIRDDIQSAVEVLRGEGDGGVAEVVGGDSGGGTAGSVPEASVRPAGEESGEDTARVEPEAARDGDAAAKRARDAAGKFTKAEAAAKAAEAKAPGAKEVAPAPAAKVAPAVDPESPATSTPPIEATKPPQSWKPAAREHWAKMPPEVQQEVTRRERETDFAKLESAESRKVHQQFREMVAPFEGMIRAEGSEPMKAVGNLLQTAAALRTAPAGHKATLIAGLCKTYGVPIDLLDQALAGQHVAEPQGQQGAYQDPRVDQLFQQLQQAGKQRGEAQMQKLQAERDQFAASHEFYDDVRHEMADQMELKAKRGIALTLEEAYDLACRANKDVAPFLEQRKAAEAAKVSLASTQRARAAASSVKSQPAGAKRAPQSGSLREDIEAAVADLQSQG